jgi:hypothetical protein
MDRVVGVQRGIEDQEEGQETRIRKRGSGKEDQETVAGIKRRLRPGPMQVCSKAARREREEVASTELGGLGVSLWRREPGRRLDSIELDLGRQWVSFNIHGLALAFRLCPD